MINHDQIQRHALSGFECSSACMAKNRYGGHLLNWVPMFTTSYFEVCRSRDHCANLRLAGSGEQSAGRLKRTRAKCREKMSADGKARDFLGIPFAAPPVGPLRWKPPQPPAKWHGERQSSTFGSRCACSRSVTTIWCFGDPVRARIASRSTSGPRPRRPWANCRSWCGFFGGGFAGGGTSEPRQDGESLTHKGVLVVSMNYRLGIFGFFATQELVAEDPHHAAGNYGLMDELAAIQWVRRNIAGFGGDPNNVTIFGESAGSFAVSAQMASPLAQGLFAHAIGESGAAFASKGIEFPAAREVRERERGLLPQRSQRQ